MVVILRGHLNCKIAQPLCQILFTFHSMPSDFKSQFMLVKRRKSCSKYSPMFLSILSNYSANETFFLIKKEHKVLFKDHARLGNNTICNIPFTPT